ncbi:MAG: energy transducer TonB [Bacteroidetes bacterium]|nr:energy transducer TonB [Bacteroidota bacterium]
MKLHFAAIAVLIAAHSYAQNSAPQKKERQRVKAGFGVSVTQTQPEFPGGADSLNSFLKKNTVYPQQAKLNGIHGRVYIGFLVDKAGKLKNIKMLSGVNEDLNNEALHVVQMMPDWKPGTTAGNAVDVQYILPIDFIVPEKR